jgi:hypothetical protein
MPIMTETEAQSAQVELRNRIRELEARAAELDSRTTQTQASTIRTLAEIGNGVSRTFDLNQIVKAVTSNDLTLLINEKDPA